jgi:hypothetical protein
MSERKSRKDQPQGDGEIRKFFKQPASWFSLIAAILSIIAAITSFITFWVVQADPGTLKAFLPDRVGLRLFDDGTLQMIVPITITNTGAPRTHRHVTRISALVHAITSNNPQSSDVRLLWSDEDEFLSPEEYKEKHKDAKIGQKDYVDYVTRAFPFHLAGNASQTRIYSVDQKSGRFPRRTDRFDLTVFLETDSGRFSYKAVYKTPPYLNNSSFEWAEMVE